MKILIVDDSLSEINNLRQIIERAGHQVITASDGVIAIELAQASQPNLIFMDIVMPNMDGFRATRHITSNPQTSHIPIVLISTKNQAVDANWAKKQGALNLIGKPYSPAQILEQIFIIQNKSKS